jgi:hypothetical protein
VRICPRERWAVAAVDGKRFVEAVMWVPVRVSVVLALVMTTLPGCEPVDEPPGAQPPVSAPAIEITGDDPEDSQVVNFGDVSVGDAREQGVTIRNLGTEPLRIQSLVLSNTASLQIIAPQDLAPTLLPDEALAVSLRYAPLQDEHIEAELVVASNDPATPEVRVRVVAEGLGGILRVDPASFDFGDLEVGCVSVLELTISNAGRAPTFVRDIWFEEVAGAGEMTAIFAIPLPLDLSPGETETAEIHYVPRDEGIHTSVLHLESVDPAAPDVIVTIFGDAHFGKTQTDQFTGQTGVDTFELSQPRFGEPLEVLYNGAVSTTGWSFDWTLNAVVFEPGRIPAVGDVIDVTYTVFGGCED